ncbi:hypothetical protein A7K93_11115 [Candidatus Methylacidiphilum fumarolicum]|uniref:hypothetical protein n=1 Tax=Candidatus Methylacidiphilum fumarolicum TaxID=591154 RepID=UPI000309EEEC|nr:hypothetical protein [Candidatus Methylacidiphilum fumarolicum]MBW6415726.1 hypothetical protein [Candidatus Methylacidiphilum fumarolicum]TFE65630.1 hypothetical protein A7K73_11140 [Candidatus Methylacidiphilum fumarolicum]TFE71206.1 hypothetical protein A7K72_11280 [Candidatus Methylacidiphilum fumarolicum]TFE71226.1 hypothetical protein A7K93_11115 [Candidatus Methylacidiphilum fumarolicum]TFE74658.1 hypothetical protein A7D33_11155 [Candidatus Methylacidiphilum fumarolicum]
MIEDSLNSSTFSFQSKKSFLEWTKSFSRLKTFQKKLFCKELIKRRTAELEALGNGYNVALALLAEKIAISGFFIQMIF